MVWKFLKIKKVEKESAVEQIGEKSVAEKIEKNTKLPNILLLSTGGTIASKIDYRTGAVTPITNC